jgi:predicted alpha-1,6-mannanase (GH76 family)
MYLLETSFYDPHIGLYTAQDGTPASTAALWPTSQVLSAAIRLAAQTRNSTDIQRVRRIIASLDNYRGSLGVFRSQTTPGSGTYYEHNDWIALDLLDAYGLLREPSYLALAQHIFDFEVTGWAATQGGGIRWAIGDADRNTVSNAPLIIIGLRLAAITHSSSYAQWASRCYAWENAHLRGPDGLYWDHIAGDGSIDKTFYSYNQGLMLEANLAYAAFTGKQYYVDKANQIAALTAKLHPGPWFSVGMSAVFDSIYYYYEALAELNKVSSSTASLRVDRTYVAWARPVATAPRTTIDEDNLFEQAAYVIDLTVLAARRWHAGLGWG